MRHDLAERMRMVYTRDDGQEVFVSHAWRRLFGIRAPLVQEFMLEFFSTCRIGDEMGLDVAGTLSLGLHTAEEMAEDGFGAYWLGSERLVPDKGDLSDYWVEISSGREFLRDAPSYTYIKDPVRRHVEGMKNGARLSRGHFIGRLAHHFSLVSDDGMRGLSVVARELPLIDMGELVKLNICMEIGDDWAWVAPGPERQPNAAAGAPRAAKDAPAVDEGNQAVLTPVQVPPPPLAAARTMTQWMARLEEDVHEICRALAEQREVIDVMAKDFSRFTVWAAEGIARLLDSTGASYTPLSETHVPYQRRVKRRTDGASTSAAQQDQQQPDT
ncbi:hypothetical protein Tco_1306165 [Tanacetum coccineum]